MKWREIEAAPKDGTWVLLLLPNDVMVCAQWVDMSVYTGWRSSYSYVAINEEPVLWAPTPSLNEEAKRIGE